MNQHDDTNTFDNPRTAPASPVTFPPIPLVSGDTTVDENGNTHPIASVHLTITTASGSAIDVPLSYRFGGWWAPDDHRGTRPGKDGTDADSSVPGSPARALVG